MKTILDPCCGSRMFWFDKKDDRAVFTDKRSERHTLCDGRELIIEPDMVMDFTDLQFDDEQFHMVVFDPPHLKNIFKWNETQILTKDILALTDQKPVVGHISGKRSNTHWICFLKEAV